MRLGLFGGAFDPPHLAHVLLAQAGLDQLALDELRIFPTGSAWHKARDLTPAHHRLEMARIAFAAVPRTVVDDREMRRTGPTYTIDTVRELTSEHPGAQLFLLMGEDQAAAFTTWRDWQAILALATPCVAARPHVSATQFMPPAGWIRLEWPSRTESATDIRARLARGNDVSALVPPGVARYIASHHLYPPT